MKSKNIVFVPGLFGWGPGELESLNWTPLVGPRGLRFKV